MQIKTIIAIAVAAILISGSIYISQDKNIILNASISEKEGVEEEIEEIEEIEVTEQIIQCLKDAGVVVYGSSTCPACAEFVQMYGGEEIISPIYLDCSGLGTDEESQKCVENMETVYVPEIQINGELYRGDRSPQGLLKEANCEL